MTLQNGLSASEFLLYFTAVGGFTTWVTGILSSFAELHRFSLDLDSIRAYTEAPEPFRFEDGEPLEPDPAKPYTIELQNVSFRYPGAEQDTLHNISLKVAPGEKLAVVGLNGAGKTTLIKLVCGSLRPDRRRRAAERRGHPPVQPARLLPAFSPPCFRTFRFTKPRFRTT